VTWSDFDSTMGSSSLRGTYAHAYCISFDARKNVNEAPNRTMVSLGDISFF
jgi:hypothetical protein